MQCMLLSFFLKLHLKRSGFVEKLGDRGGQIVLYVVAALMFTANKCESVWSDSILHSFL